MNSTFQLGTKRLGTVSPKKYQKNKQNKTFRFFISFSQNSSFAEKISMNEKDFHST